MLRKKERLNREAFNRFFSAGTRTHSQSFGLVYVPHPTFHASVVVPKKIVQKAVARNKLRRRIYDILRNFKQKDGPTGVYIVMVKPKAATSSYDELKTEIEGLVGRTMKSR